MIVGQIHGQSLRVVYPTVASDTVGYLEAAFDFVTDDWEGLVKWAHFKKGDTVYDVKLTDDRIERSDNLNLEAGVWEVYLHGNATVGGEVVMRITTEIQKLIVKESGVLQGQPLPEVPLSVAEQIMATAEEALSVAESVRAEAENGMFDGEKGDKGDIGERGEKGEKGDKGDKGDAGEVTLAYANRTFSNALFGERSGLVVTLDDVAPDYKVLSVVSTINPVQADGEPSRDNVLPISTRSGMTLTVSGEGESKDFSASFGEEIYGGRLDWRTGVLTVDWVRIDKSSFKDTNICRIQSVNDHGVTNILVNMERLPHGEVYANDKTLVMCDRLKRQTTSISQTTEEGICLANYTSLYLRLMAAEVSTNEEFAAWVDAYDPQIVYRLKNPYTLQLTSQQIEALSGTTTVFGDAGDTAVTYNRDINKAFAELQQAIISLGGNV